MDNPDLFMAGDFNRQVSDSAKDCEDQHGGYGFKVSNKGGTKTLQS